MYLCINIFIIFVEIKKLIFMELKEVRNKRDKLEKEIFELLNIFERETAVSIDAVEIEQITIRSITSEYLREYTSINNVIIKSSL